MANDQDHMPDDDAEWEIARHRAAVFRLLESASTYISDPAFLPLLPSLSIHAPERAEEGLRLTPTVSHFLARKLNCPRKFDANCDSVNRLLAAHRCSMTAQKGAQP
jgi:hypothetical protein